MVIGSWIMDHGSWIMDHGSWIMDHGSSWIMMDHGLLMDVRDTNMTMNE